MEVDGREIAQNLLQELSFRVKKLQQKGIIPHLVIILLGENPFSQSYVRQKKLKAEEIGTKITIKKCQPEITQLKLVKIIKELNNNNNIHGIIIQRPLPAHLDGQTISLAIDPRKDLDGFHPLSKFQPPLATAVLKILEEIFSRLHLNKGVTLTKWLKSKKIVVIGKGETGGGPVIKRLKELGIKPQVIDSKTPNPELITKQADIIIPAVGKSNVIKPNQIKRGVILIGIGLHQKKDGKLHGDYNEEEIKNIASFYTPTPGGVGPVNVACLLENLVRATKSET